MNPNFNGVWKADLQKSKLLGPMPEALVAEIKEAGEELTTEMLIAKEMAGRTVCFSKVALRVRKSPTLCKA